ncbi:MAG TPA: mechanosensitive ion channel family protein [Longimicrobiales bacterium]|nr:mechanosensitive ion channel family protein [Longimicrobiales bacterium]
MSDFLSGILDRLAVIFDPAALGAGLAELVANVLIGLATFAVYYLIWRVVQPVFRQVAARTGMDPTSRDFTQTTLKLVILTFGLVSALAAVGVNTASLLASMGVVGLTIGFAARDAMSNLISGLFIYWDRPFVVGDLVEVGPSYGRVARITLRSTRVVTPDGRMLAVPNAEIINTTVASSTNFPGLRLSVPVTIGVAESLERVRDVLLELVRDDAYMQEPAPRVVVEQLHDYNVLVELQVWIRDERMHIEERQALRERVFRALRNAGIDMPFETLRLEPLTIRREEAA